MISSVTVTNLRTRNSVVSDLHSETKGFRLKSGCKPREEVSSLQWSPVLVSVKRVEVIERSYTNSLPANLKCLCKKTQIEKKCDQIRSFLKKSLMENFNFCLVIICDHQVLHHFMHNVEKCWKVLIPPDFQNFIAWCPLKGPTYSKKPAAFDCKYVWPLSGHQALKGWSIFNYFSRLCIKEKMFMENVLAVAIFGCCLALVTSA